MKIAAIGAGGFVGEALTRVLLAQCARDDRIVLIDQTPFAAPVDPRIETHLGSFADPNLRESALDGADKVILLASILGGAAEANYALSRQVNIDATLSLFEHLRDRNPKTRVVFASTIAVFAKPLPALVTDDTPTGPSIIYGAQKLMREVALSNFAAKGWLDGVSVRPSGVMARPGADARLRTAFMSRLFHAIRDGEDITLPVHPDARTWIGSVDCVARNFVHAAHIASEALGTHRAFTLPALRVSFAELVEALHARFPQSSSRVEYAPDPELVSLFGAYPELETPIADRLGFSRDRDIDDLVNRAYV